MLSISAVGTMSTPKFAQHLRTFAENNPNTEISLSDESCTNQIKDLLTGKTDVGFLGHTAYFPPSISFQVISKIPLQIVVRKSHPISEKNSVLWRDLKGLNLIHLSSLFESHIYYKFLSCCEDAGFSPKLNQYATNISPQLWPVSAGLGIALPPLSRDYRLPSNLTSISLPEDAPIFETVIAWRKSDCSPLLKNFLDFILHKFSTAPKKEEPKKRHR